MIRPRLITTSDPQAWKEALPTNRSVMGSLEYVRIQERYFDLSGGLFTSETEGCRISYPFFLRPVPPQACLGGREAWDTTTPEYTGPIIVHDGGGTPPPAWQAKFREEFEAFCRTKNIIAEFAHLNPWSADLEMLDPACVELNRELVYIDLTWGEEAIWSRSLSSDARRQTRQAQEQGVTVRRATKAADVLAFHHLHHSTMVRRAALKRYFLPPEYFLEIFETMPENAFYMLSEYQGQVVAGGLYFQDATDVFWHLSAVDMDFSKVRPVNAYHFEAIRATMAAGKTRLICGGAHNPGDGVFRFKAGFSPLRVPFSIYKRVHDPALYATLAAAWHELHPGLQPQGDYFPIYRAEPKAAAEDGDAALPGTP